MTDSKVYLIKGWKIEGSELVDELLNKLDEVSEDYYGEFEDYFLEFQSWLSRLRTQLVAMRTQVQSLALLSGPETHCCHVGHSCG